MEIYIDGSSIGNPGPSGAGIVFVNGNQIIDNISVYLGRQTNNVAEYMALLIGLQKAVMRGEQEVTVYTDSQLLCRQVNNEYKVKNANLIGFYEQVKRLLSTFKYAEIRHIPREENKGADKLAKKATKNKT